MSENKDPFVHPIAFADAAYPHRSSYQDLAFFSYPLAQPPRSAPSQQVYHVKENQVYQFI